MCSAFEAEPKTTVVSVSGRSTPRETNFELYKEMSVSVTKNMSEQTSNGQTESRDCRQSLPDTLEKLTSDKGEG